MKTIVFIRYCLLVAVSVVFFSCEKNYTVFYEDDDAEYLSVFSDNGYNVMPCYINGQPFRTRDRIYTGGFNGGHFTPEVELYKDNTAADSDTLIIVWQRDVISPLPRSVSLVLAVKKGFTYNDFGVFNNTRLTVDGVNGYFILNQDRTEKGTGNIYFRRATIMPNDSSGTNSLLSGIFEATLPSYTITRGRFDHTLASGVVSF